MKYAHLADLHLGSWRDPKLRDLSTQAFLQAINNCIKESVDFILFAGDLFNTSLPSLDTLKIVTKQLKTLQNHNIPLYVIPGSHDFSPSGKTMIDVLENAGLLKNVCKGTIDQETKQLHLTFTTDEKTQTKITGIVGKRGLLDKTYYENLSLDNLEQEPGYKIFMFHTTLTELLPTKLALIESQPVSIFPKHFNYYAGGHIHHPTLHRSDSHPLVTYTGALFPNNFQELEEYSHGGYYILTVENNHTNIEYIPLNVINHIPFSLNCTGKAPEIILYETLNQFQNQDLTNTIVTLKFHGTLTHGKISDINFNEIITKLLAQHAYAVLKNTNKLVAEQFEEIKLSSQNPQTIEQELINEHLQQFKLFDKQTEHHLITSLIQTLNTTKHEGETQTDFQHRIETETQRILNIT